MKIKKIYEKYKIMPQLQLHMLRVAGVASIICDNFEEKVDRESIIAACLLHDTGNIIKFKLDLFPENLKEKGLQYWQNVQNHYRKKYGTDDHKATEKICKQLGLNKKVIYLVSAYGFSNGPQILKTDSFEKKICVYSDMRVSPKGVSSLDLRLSEARKRYLSKKKSTYTKKHFDTLIPVWVKIEKQIFAKCKIKPSDITNKSVNPYLKTLENFEIKTLLQ